MGALKKYEKENPKYFSGQIEFLHGFRFCYYFSWVCEFQKLSEDSSLSLHCSYVKISHQYHHANIGNFQQV